MTWDTHQTRRWIVTAHLEVQNSHLSRILIKLSTFLSALWNCDISGCHHPGKALVTSSWELRRSKKVFTRTTKQNTKQTEKLSHFKSHLGEFGPVRDFFVLPWEWDTVSWTFINLSSKTFFVFFACVLALLCSAAQHNIIQHHQYLFFISNEVIFLIIYWFGFLIITEQELEQQPNGAATAHRELNSNLLRSIPSLATCLLLDSRE